MPDFVFFKDSNGASRKLKTTVWNTNDDVITLVTSSSNQGGGSQTVNFNGLAQPCNVVNGVNALNVNANGSALIRNLSSEALTTTFANTLSLRDSFLEDFTSGVAIGVSLATLITVDVRNFDFLSVEITNGVVALAECQVQAKYHSGSSVWHPKTFGATEYTTGSGKQSGNSRITIIEASGNLNILGVNASGWVEIDCSRYESIRLQARVVSGTSIVTTRVYAK